MSKRKNTIIIICFILVILLGAGAAAYPLIASINNEHTQSLVQTEYEEKLQQLDTSEIDAALAAAREYNKTISTVQIEDVDKIKADLPPYEDLLNLANNGIMGYIMIPAINIDLPIYHGTTGAAMEKGAGHMEGTSLPVGGIGTHAVISAHSGMASAKLFTDLDRVHTICRVADRAKNADCNIQNLGAARDRQCSGGTRYGYNPHADVLRCPQLNKPPD